LAEPDGATQKKTDGTNPGSLGGLILLPFFAIALYGLVMGVPYLYNRATTPWAGSAGNPNTLTGTWIGTVAMRPKSYYKSFIAAGGQGVPPPPAASPAVVKLTVSMEFQWGIPKIKGRAEACDATGQHYRSRYHNEILLDGSKLRLLLKEEDSPNGYTHLNGNFSPGTLTVKWPFRPDGDASGTLHKGAEEEFEQLCHSLKQTR
jgi:hypothetical protein